MLSCIGGLQQDMTNDFSSPAKIIQHWLLGKVASHFPSPAKIIQYWLLAVVAVVLVVVVVVVMVVVILVMLYTSSYKFHFGGPGAPNHKMRPNDFCRL